MSDDFTYHDYVNDEKYLEKYNAYQARHAVDIRESDKVIISMVRQLVDQANGRRLKVLDIGCSTGNLLMHLKRLVPEVDYMGGDLARSSLETCKANPNLQGIDFQAMDILDLPSSTFDIIIVNAVLYMFDDAQYERALAELNQALTNKGSVIVYDFIHSFVHQNLTIYETSLLHPDGMRLCFRPMSSVSAAVTRAGFSAVEFHPFELPIELSKPGYDEEVVTYTVNTDKNDRLMFRGALYQPWCHMVAQKP
jgi:SAM-dependent methyltransferase